MNNLLLLFATLLILACSSSPLSSTSGSGTGTGNPIVVGAVSHPDGSMIDSATIIIRKENSTADDSDYSYLGDEFDTNGYYHTAIDSSFRFTLKDTGTYILEIRDTDGSLAMQRITVQSDKISYSGELTLSTPDTISGTVSFHGAEKTDARLYVYGTDRSIKIDSTGHFTTEVPVGIHRLKITPNSDAYRSWSSEMITSGTHIDEIMILAKEPLSYSYQCDSLIVRAFLDSNDLHAVAVSQITEIEDGRIEELDVAPEYSFFGINVSSYITVIPTEIGGLLELEELEIQYTSITELPESIGNLTEIEELELNDNQLTSLPESITRLRPQTQLSLSRNHLRLEGDVKKWANYYDPDWADSQE